MQIPGLPPAMSMSDADREQAFGQRRVERSGKRPAPHEERAQILDMLIWLIPVVLILIDAISHGGFK